MKLPYPQSRVSNKDIYGFNKIASDMPLHKSQMPQFVVKCHGLNRRAIECLYEQLRRFQLHIEELSEQKYSRKRADDVYFSVSCDRSMLEDMADKNKLLKRTHDGRMEPFSRNHHAEFERYDQEDFFLPCEEVSLLWDILHRVPTTTDFNLSLNSAKRKHVTGQDSIIAVALWFKLIRHICALHTDKVERNAIWNDCRWTFYAADRIRSYYGSKIALYFAWMEHFTIWLLAPGLLGSILWLHNTLNDDTSMDNSLLAPIYTFFLIGWSALFVQFWRRKCATICCDWGTSNESETSRVLMRKHHVSYLEYFFRYSGSVFITTLMLFGAFIVMILALNLQGYIEPKALGGSWLYMESLSAFAKPGALFDQSGGGLLPYIPVILQSLTIYHLNLLYREIATVLTDWENHKVEESHENSLIVKRFLFEAFDCYLALFYLAFFQEDLSKLQTELAALYTIDSLRRVLTETLVPLIRRGFSLFKRQETYRLLELKLDWKMQMELEPYEKFDDYMEMVIQFGYVVLFASAFPLAAVLSVLCNLIELKSDLFKLTYVMQRPLVVRTDTIGIWQSILTSIVWVSAMTNVLIIGFTTHQLAQIFPSLYQSDYQAPTNGMGRWIVASVVVLEHVILFLVQSIFLLVRPVPEAVRIEIQRRERRRVLKLEFIPL